MAPPNHFVEDRQRGAFFGLAVGDDADTTGAVCGQIAGACWGCSSIPKEWLEGLVRSEMIEDALSRLITAFQTP